MDRGKTLRPIWQTGHGLVATRTTHFFGTHRSKLTGLLLIVSILIAMTWLGTSAFAQSSDFDSLVSSAAAARSQGDTARAIELYTRAVQLNPSWPEGWWSLGTLQYGADQYAAAGDALSHLIALNPDATAALALRGLCEFETAQYQESLQDLEHGIALGAANQPRNAQIILYHEALVLTRLGRFDEAIGKFTYFVKQAPGNPELTVAVGLAGLRMPLLPKDVDPAQTELITMVGQAAIDVMTGDAAGGRRAFQAVFDRYPTTPNVHYLYGYLLYTTLSDETIPEFRKEIAISPHSAIAHAMLAWALEFQGDFAAALPDAQKATVDDPSLSMGQLVYGRALVETGDVTDGLARIQNVLNTEPGNLEAHLTLAKAYSKLGRSDDARQERMLCLQLADQGAVSRATP
jgi:tetratricopeptide (TPR) repeat protein